MDKKQRSINEQKRLGVYDRNEYIKYLCFVKHKKQTEIARMYYITKQRVNQILKNEEE